MKFIADFHVHSKFSRATSKDMDIEHLTQWAKIKGISVLGTGDFTHPVWLAELKSKLKPLDNGLFIYDNTYFILTTEVSNIFSTDGKLKKIHNMIFAPSFEAVDKINLQLEKHGNLFADGRPILNMDAQGLVKIVLDVSPDCLIVPGHIWTPWFSLFGSNSGFDSVEACFGKQTKNIFCLETGLSSDPAINWRLSALDKFTLISNSDSHSPSKIGREANVFDTKISYSGIMDALKTKDKNKFLFTVEFFPQEGKYHYDGHRNCQIRFSPTQTKQNKSKCPNCGKPLTIGVMNRVEQLADRPEGFIPENAVPFKSLVPLVEIIAGARAKSVDSQIVETEYKGCIQRLGNEFKILVDTSEEELTSSLPAKIAEGIIKVRNGNIDIQPGYDGIYGTINIFGKSSETKERQLELF